ncbi:MAG: hypothetical protein H6737_02325 [Alphaproteobacteria bacterium]|nr:hypothetical protein [Alphaproteobacteria bacterium]
MSWRASQIFGFVGAVAVQIAVWLVYAWVVRTPLLMPFVPGGAVLGAFLFLRPARSIPAGFAIRDWGRTLGQAWVSDGTTVVWTGAAEARERALEAAPLEVSDGLEAAVVLTPRPDGLPPLAHTARWSPVVLIGACLVGLPWTLATADLSVPMALVGVGVMALAGCLLQLPWLLPLAGLSALRASRGRAVRVEIAGRVVKADGRTFTLGHPDERITRGDGRLVLENPSGRLVLRGGNAAIDWLHREILRRTEVGGDAAVPDALRRVQGVLER